MCFSSQAELYKYKGPDGNYYYSDVLPPSAAPKERTVMDDKGIKVKEVERTKSEAEYKAWQERNRAELARRKREEEQKQADEQLLRQYRDEKEILKDEERKLSSVDIHIERIRDRQDRQRQMIAKYRKRAAQYERAGRKVPAKLLNMIETAKKELGALDDKIAEKRKVQKAIKMKFRKLVDRYRSLVGSKNLSRQY